MVINAQQQNSSPYRGWHGKNKMSSGIALSSLTASRRNGLLLLSCKFKIVTSVIIMKQNFQKKLLRARSICYVNHKS